MIAMAITGTLYLRSNTIATIPITSTIIMVVGEITGVVVEPGVVEVVTVFPVRKFSNDVKKFDIIEIFSKNLIELVYILTDQGVLAS